VAGHSLQSTDGKNSAARCCESVACRADCQGSQPQRFEREARLASSLDHSNICTIFDLDEAEGLHFIAMQVRRGRNVRQLVGGHPLELKSA